MRAMNRKSEIVVQLDICYKEKTVLHAGYGDIWNWDFFFLKHSEIEAVFHNMGLIGWGEEKSITILWYTKKGKYINLTVFN